MTLLAKSPFTTRHPGTIVRTKFVDPEVTLDGSRRASVGLDALRTLWFNTGTVCNITCVNCYIESSPLNDRLEYLTLADVESYLDEIRSGGHGTVEIGFTGGEPFMNPESVDMIELALARGFDVLVLTNAMRPMMRWGERLRALASMNGGRLTLRVSLDHHTQPVHDAERGEGAWEKAWQGLTWLREAGFRLAIAGRRLASEDEAAARAAYAALFESAGLNVDAADPGSLVLFPEMEPTADVPEITEACWGILHRSPSEMMCASSRMVVRRKGAGHAVVVACTLTPYDPQFELGRRLSDATENVKLNHPFCAQFCVLGGASCSAT
jgi:uncharacterized Fe-S cluster-containing radical SAM superfamily protein